MGRIPREETIRNKNLISDYLEIKDESATGRSKWKYSIKDLSAKYARVEDGETIPLTSSRIHQILRKYGVEKTRLNKRKKSA